jgi:hypothetical protein
MRAQFRIKPELLFRLVVSFGIFLAAQLLSTPALGTPSPNAAKIETRTFNDCPLSTLTVTNNYPASIQITDEMHPACVGFANLHSWSFSEDGGVTAAVFNNNSNFRFGADFKIEGPGQGLGGLRISPWFGQFVDGRFEVNSTSGEIVCFGGTLPFYSFTASHGLSYINGTTIHLEMTYQANDLVSTDPATIRYRVIYNGNTYESPVLPFEQHNPAECNPNGLWGMQNDGRVGGYFQPRANTHAALTGMWSNIDFQELPAVGTPVANGATVATRTFNDCPLSTLTVTNNYPASIQITDEMHPACVGFANLHSWSFSEDGGVTAAVFNNNSNFRFGADFKIEGPGQGLGGLRISPWFGQFVDGPLRGQLHVGGDRLLWRDSSLLFLHRKPRPHLHQWHDDPPGDDVPSERSGLHRSRHDPVPGDLQRQHLREPGAALRTAQSGGVQSERPLGNAERWSRRRLLPAASQHPRCAYRMWSNITYSSLDSMRLPDLPAEHGHHQPCESAWRHGRYRLLSIGKCDAGRDLHIQRHQRRSPFGLNLNAATGAITGTPTSPGTSTFTVSAAVDSCAGTRTYTLAVECPSLSITTAALPAAVSGTAYSQTVNVSPAGSYTFSLTRGNLPSGMSLNPSTGLISGLAMVPGTYAFIVKAQLPNGCNATQPLSITINCPTITVNPAALPNGQIGTAYSQMLSALPAASYVFSVAGSLPPGLSVNALTGLLSGTPTANGTYNFTVTATMSYGCAGSQSYALTIAPGACPAITTVSTTERKGWDTLQQLCCGLTRWELLVLADRDVADWADVLRCDRPDLRLSDIGWELWVLDHGDQYQ